MNPYKAATSAKNIKILSSGPAVFCTMQSYRNVCYFWFSYTDVNDCANQPCKNGGQCRDLDGDYNCQCPSPYVGKQCQQRESFLVYMSLYLFYIGNKIKDVLVSQLL